MTNTTKLTPPNSSVATALQGNVAPPDIAIGHSDEELIDAFSQARGKRFCWSASLTKSAIVGASGFGMIAAISFALLNDANSQAHEGYQEIPSDASSSALPDSIDSAMPPAVSQRPAAARPSVEFSSRPTAPMPAGPRLFPLPVLRTAPSTLQPLPKPNRLPSQPRLPMVSSRALPYAFGGASLNTAPQAPASGMLPHTAPRQTASRQTLPSTQLSPADPNPMPPGVSAPLPPTDTPMSEQVTTATSLPQTLEPEGSPFQKQAELQPIAGARLQIVGSIAFATDRLPEMSPPQFSVQPATAEVAAPIGSPSPAAPEADIHYFLDRSQQPAPNRTSLLPLTSRAATEVPMATELAEFRVFRLAAADYLQVWSSVSSDVALPEHGFIDYQRQVIVLPVHILPVGRASVAEQHRPG